MCGILGASTSPDWMFWFASQGRYLERQRPWGVVVNRTYEYRLYPRKRERVALETLLEQHREVYNTALEQCRNAYEVTGRHQTAISQWPYFRDWRKAFPDLILN